MATRRTIQDRHESSLVDQFIEWWQSVTGERFSVIERPEPPDALIRSNERTTWIEVTDAFYSSEWAQDKYSYATPGEKHVPVIPEMRHNPDAAIANEVVRVIKTKLSKESYRPTYQTYGQGILMVKIQDPLADDNTIDEIRMACEGEDWSTDRGFFSKVIISDYRLDQPVFFELQIPSINTR